MKSKQNKKVPPVFASKTWQELAVKQLLLQAKIPFVQQKQIQLSKCYVVVDFLINNKIMLEVSATRMHRHGVPLKLKALQIEAKFAKLRQEAGYLLWVLFESSRPIPRRLYNALLRRMPSTDRLLTSRARLRRILRCHFRNSALPPTSKRVLLQKNGTLQSFLGIKQRSTQKTINTGLRKYSSPPVKIESRFSSFLRNDRVSHGTTTHFRRVHKYSHERQKKFTEGILLRRKNHEF